MSIFKGVGVALITPFGSDGVNYTEFGKLIEHVISGGADALVVGGTTGEPSTMTRDERVEAIRFVVEKTAKRVPVIAGTGGNNTAEAVEMSRTAETLGVDGLLVVTPYYNKCTQGGLIVHYNAIADAVNIPIMLYNVPTRTCLNIAPETALELSKHKNIVAIKDASENVDHLLAMCRICEGKLDIYSGNDTYTSFLMALGSVGVISVAANIIPREMKKITDCCFAGDYNGARKVAWEIDELVKALFIEVNPIPTKKAAQLIGIDAGLPRLPLTELTNEHTAVLKKAMKGLKLI